jgi:hypothetical protein
MKENIKYKKLLDESVDILAELMSQADEDTPHEYRTRHFDESMMTAHDFITKYKRETK